MEFKYEREPMRVIPLDERWFRGVTPLARKHLLSSLRSLEAGRAPTPSFKLYGKSDVSLVDDFFALVKASGLELPKWQLEYEMSRKSKWGPQGGYKPWSELKENFELYYSRPSEINESEISKYYTFSDRDELTDRYDMRLSKESYSATLKHLIADDKIQTRAAGWRCFNLKKTDPLAQQQALADAKSGSWVNGFFYTFSRYNKLKARIFFPGPFPFMIVEAQYYYPFLKYIQEDLKLRGCMSPYTFWADKIGFDKMFKNIVSPLLVNHKKGHLVFVQRDFEKMDTTTGFAQTKFSFFRRLKKAFRLGPKESIDLLKILYFGATSPVATPDGMYIGYRGKASGANTTNGDETCSNEDYDKLLNTILSKLCAAAGIKYRVIYSGGNGDDGVTIYELTDLRRLSTFKKLIAQAADIAAAAFGFRVQGSKWFISTEYGLYCQRMIKVVGDLAIDMYPATLILNAIVNPEKEYTKSTWDKDYRDLDIIEKLDNGKNLPYFHLLIDYVDNGMKFHLLGRSEIETKRILSKYDRYRALRDEPFNYQDPELPFNISRSPTVQYLLNKRKLTHLLG